VHSTKLVYITLATERAVRHHSSVDAHSVSTIALDNVRLQKTKYRYCIYLETSKLKILFLIKEIINLDVNFSNLIINQQFVRVNLELMQRYLFNDLLHNAQK
jgi:hypothetical protein